MKMVLNVSKCKVLRAIMATISEICSIENHGGLSLIQLDRRIRVIVYCCDARCFENHAKLIQWTHLIFLVQSCMKLRFELVSGYIAKVSLMSD